MPNARVTPAPAPAETAPHAERVRGADGLEYWKLTCFCGKLLLAPYTGPHTQGRCTQCGVRLRFPTERPITGGPLPVIPARRPQRQIREKPNPSRPGIDASGDAADKLRPPGAPSERLARGLISAWPAASLPRRMLAFFVDVTLALAVAALVLAGGRNRTLLAGGIALLFWLANDAAAQILLGGSIGKLLAVIVIRGSEGAPPKALQLVFRAALKLLLLPLFPLIFTNSDLRALHDRAAGTRVLRGRAK